MEAIFLDFDGVIVDSIGEWYHTGVLAYYGIDKAIPDCKHRELYKSNCHLLYSSKDEYCLLKALEQDDIKSFEKIRKEVKKEEVNNYISQFKRIRRFYQNNHLDWWCNLHSLTNYGKTLRTEKKNYFILTRKNIYDVLMLKNFFDIKILDANVFDYNCSVTYGGKIDFIEMFLSTHQMYEKAILIDDKTENLRDSPIVKCYFASWGYGRKNNRFEVYQWD